MELQMGSKAEAVALVRASLLSDPDNISWVPSYSKIRWAPNQSGCVVECIGGHFRRKAHVKRTADALACVCKQPDFVIPLELHPPLVTHKKPRPRVFGP